MKTFNKITEEKIPFDASGIEYPNNWLWSDSTKSPNILWSAVHYPVLEIVKNVEIREDYDQYRVDFESITVWNNGAYDRGYVDYNATFKVDDMGNLEFEWGWNGDEDGEVPRYVEEVEQHIDECLGAMLYNDKPTPNDHLRNLVAIIDELEGADLIDLEDNFPQYHKDYQEAKHFLTLPKQ